MRSADRESTAHLVGLGLEIEVICHHVGEMILPVEPGRDENVVEAGELRVGEDGVELIGPMDRDWPVKGGVEVLKIGLVQQRQCKVF